ncbi:MAG: RNA polymerase subunit sigma-70, partial [bacterium]|nr:RNA polymerase subunit sigma-70 [bacterium]
MTNEESEVTRLLKDWSAGEPGALERLMPLVFDHVRDLAARALAHESPEHTLQPTALVNEVYLRLAGRRSVQWKNREQFFGFLADVMRRILVDHARRRHAAKRGGDAIPIPLEEVELAEMRSP